MADKKSKKVKMKLSKVKELLDQYASLEIIEDKNLIKCSITGHEMPCSEDAIVTYVNGKKYQRLAKDNLYCDPYLTECKQYLKQSGKTKSVVYCILTKKPINNIPSHIWKHINGKRFKRALDKAKAAANLLDESQGDNEMWIPSDVDSDADGEEEDINDDDDLRGDAADDEIEELNGTDDDDSDEPMDVSDNEIVDIVEEVASKQKASKDIPIKKTKKRILIEEPSKASKSQKSKVKRKK